MRLLAHPVTGTASTYFAAALERAGAGDVVPVRRASCSG
jgi:hypothetical protein